jgi:hypothetical protein
MGDGTVCKDGDDVSVERRGPKRTGSQIPSEHIDFDGSSMCRSGDVMLTLSMSLSSFKKIMKYV